MTPRTGDPTTRASASRRARLRALPVLVAGLLLLATHRPADAQRVERAGEGEPALDLRLSRLLNAGDYLLVTRDTLIGEGDRVLGSVLVIAATFTLEGEIGGDLVGVDANVFLRPTARVRGDAVNIAGGLYRSELAAIGGRVVDRPSAPYRVERGPDVIRIVGTTRTPRIVLRGLLGFEAPTYDRVNALGLNWGASYLLPARGRVEPRVNGWVGYRSGRGDLDGGLEFEVRRGKYTAFLGAEKRTVTNEEWIRGDLHNSLSFLVRGKDYRNYYETETVYARLERRFGREGRGAVVRVDARSERAGSLGAGDPWVLFDGAFRPNPPIDEGRIASLGLGLTGDWIGNFAAAEAGAEAEVADDVLGADFRFARYALWGEWAMDALADHVLEVEWRFQGPAPGTRSLPRQRWSFVGGSGTLPTFDIGEFRGDRLVFVESKYIIPIARTLTLFGLGPPELQVIHVFGMAWTEDTPRDLEQNIGVRLQFFGPYFRVTTNPVAPLDDIDFGIGLSWPFDDKRRWRRR